MYFFTESICELQSAPCTRTSMWVSYIFAAAVRRAPRFGFNLPSKCSAKTSVAKFLFNKVLANILIYQFRVYPVSASFPREIQFQDLFLIAPVLQLSGGLRTVACLFSVESHSRQLFSFPFSAEHPTLSSSHLLAFHTPLSTTTMSNHIPTA